MTSARLSEDKFQIATKQYFDLVLKPLGAVYAHATNEGKRTPLQGKRAKDKGLLPGFPDWVIFHRGQTIMIELKTTTKKSALTPEQIAFKTAIEAAGFKYFVCRTWAEIDLALSVIGVGERAVA